MKRFLILTIAFLLCFSASACKAEKANENNIDKAPVIINLPDDDTVNGYRTGKAASNDGNIVDASSVKVGNPNISSKTANNSGNNIGGQYCVNINSGIFHKSACSSVGKIKDTNKKYFADRQTVISEGYKPCKLCNP